MKEKYHSWEGCINERPGANSIIQVDVEVINSDNGDGVNVKCCMTSDQTTGEEGWKKWTCAI